MLSQLVLLLLAVVLAMPLPFLRLEIAQPRKDDVNYRLPTNIKPIKYTVRLDPDIPNAKLSGSVVIEIKALEETDSITLHHRKLTIPKEGITVTDRDEAKVKVIETAVGEVPEQEFFIIKLEKKLKKGSEYVVDIASFTGTLADDNTGFYWAEYKDETGSTKRFATTQFEPTNARRAFPCFDEPALKAKFRIFLRRPNYCNAIANTPLLKTKKIDDNKSEDEFEETTNMSTYLLAFIVSELDNSAKGTQRVFARPRAKKDGSDIYALETGIEILDAIEKFVGVMYSFEKMDQAAIPDKYFSAGAMENWGLVTYREQYLLADKHTTTNVNQSIATIIAHEYGHQWFGNHVGPAWWKYIWLNEGFATYFEFYGASVVFPEWRLMDQFVVKNTQYAFGPDSLSSTRTMNHDAGTPSEISALFDRIAYQKSGSVIRMMEMFLTTPVYKQGLNSYLKSRGLKEATPAHLYNNLQDALNKNSKVNLPYPLETIMQSWDGTKGFPVIYVQRNSPSEEDITIEQSRFLLENPQDSSTDVWYIPLNFATKVNPNFENTSAEEWLSVKSKVFKVPGLNYSTWLIVNKQQTGYYRVNYDEENWKLIIEALKSDPSQIHLLNRAQLIDDSFNLARSGRLKYGIPLELATHLQKEHDYIPFYSFFTAASFLNTMLPGSTTYAPFKNYVLSLLNHVQSHIGLEEKPADEHLDKVNRVNVINWLCNMGHEGCRAHTLETFKKWMKNSSLVVAPDLQAPVYCGAMRTASQEEWDFLFTKYLEVDDSEDTYLRTTRFNALGCSEDPYILEGFLSKSPAAGNKFTRADVFSNVYSSGEVGVAVAFQYVEKNFKSLRESLKDSMASILTGIGGKLTTVEQLNRLQALADSNKDDEKMFTSTIALAQQNVDWNKKYIPDIHDSLPSASPSLRISFILIAVAVLKQLL